MNAFNGVTSHRVLYYCYVLPLRFNFSLTSGLKPEVSGIKVVTIYRRSISQIEWLTATLILRARDICVRVKITWTHSKLWPTILE